MITLHLKVDKIIHLIYTNYCKYLWLFVIFLYTKSIKLKERLFMSEENVTNIRIVDDKRSGLATACLVLGIISIVGSWIPFLNAFSIILAFVGIALGIPALIIFIKKKKGTLGKSLAGLILCILSLIFAFSMNKAAVDSINETFGSDEASQIVYDYGEAAELDGISIKVLNVEKNSGYTKNYINVKPDNDGDEFVIVEVEIKNISEETKAFNVLDFSIQTGNGEIRSAGFSMYDTGNDLGSGSLAPGGTKVGKIVLTAPKDDNNLLLIYKGNMFDSKERKFKLQ